MYTKIELGFLHGVMYNTNNCNALFFSVGGTSPLFFDRFFDDVVVTVATFLLVVDFFDAAAAEDGDVPFLGRTGFLIACSEDDDENDADDGDTTKRDCDGCIKCNDEDDGGDCPPVFLLVDDGRKALTDAGMPLIIESPIMSTVMTATRTDKAIHQLPLA